jgi:protein-disulfide isomerase
MRLFAMVAMVGLLAISLVSGVIHAQDGDSEEIELPETFESTDGSLSFNYPSGWQPEEQDFLVVLFEEREDNAQTQVILVFKPSLVTQIGANADSDAAEVLELTLPNLVSEEAVVGEITPVEIGAEAGQRVEVEEGGFLSVYLALEKDEGIAVIGIIGEALPVSAFEPTFEAIAASIELAGAETVAIPLPDDVEEERVLLEAALGPDDAGVTIYEYGSYGCHSCRLHYQRGGHAEIEALLEHEDYAGDVRFVFVNFPVIVPQLDALSAETAQCVLDQGQEAFWEFHDAMYSMSDAEYAQLRTVTDYVSFTEGLGLESEQVDSCLEEGTYRQTVTYHLQVAWEELGIRATPTFYVNDRRLPDFGALETMVLVELSEGN